MGRKEPPSLFENSRGRRPRWCGQPLRVVGLGGWHLAWDLSPVRAHSLWVGLCPEKLVNRAGKQINQVYYETNPPNTASGGASSQGWTWSWNLHVISH